MTQNPTRHPAEIAKEIRQYSFFAGFDEPLLLQISTMVREVDFLAGTLILTSGKMNDQLYFLRSGMVDVLVGSEKINSLFEPGEVLGEMSILSGKPVMADLRAETTVQCFAISADHFAHVHPNQKDRFQFLLYRIYSSVLSERLAKTNEKAKMYEITARELVLAQKELAQVTQAQMNFLLEKGPNLNKKVLFLEPDRKQQIVIKSAMGGTGVELLIAKDQTEAQDLFLRAPDVIFCDDSNSEFLLWCQEQKFQGSLVLVQSLGFNFEQLQKINFVQNAISLNREDRAGTIKNLLTTLAKILHQDYFGPQKYLAWGTELKEKILAHSTDRGPLGESLLTEFRALGVRSSILDRVQVAAEEMMMNAIYDAPVDCHGKSLYNHLPRATPVHLKITETSKIRYASDGLWLAIAVEDPFGGLTREIVIKYLHSCYQGSAGSLNAGKGGAGRGLHQILESCDLTVFNVKPGNKTEVIGLFDIDRKRDSVSAPTPQFQFFFAK